MRFQHKEFDDKFLLKMYHHLLLPRVIEEQMLIQLKHGRIGKWFSAYGQEAISIGASMAMNIDEFILFAHRNLGVFTSRGLNLTQLFAQILGKKEGFTKGRDRSFHFGSLKHRLVGTISHMAAQLPVANGIGLGHLNRNEKKAVLVFCGDGATSEGDFHESVNVASVMKLPVIFLIENNHYATSTPLSQQVNFKSFKVKGTGYGIEAHSVDGNNVISVYKIVKKAANKIKENPQPILIEARTMRMRGHEESSGTSYMDQAEMKVWKSKDPIINFEDILIKRKIINTDEIIGIKKKMGVHVKSAFETSYNFIEPVYTPQEELGDVYASHVNFNTSKQASGFSEMRYMDAIRDALDQSLNEYKELVLMGQDIETYGGIFKITEGLSDKYGKDRVKNTPLCESAILGMSIGLSVLGIKSVIEMQFADFITCGFNQVVNNIAKTHYRWGMPINTVIRMPSGGSTGAGPFHSQSTESWFFRVPGLKIVYPSSPFDAKGLLNASIDNPNPVLFFEHKKLYRSVYGQVPNSRYTLELGKAKVVHEGNSLSLITYGMGIRWGMELLNTYPDELEIIDLMTLLPWDKTTVVQSVEKTGKALILHEDNLSGGIGAEIAAYIGEHCFEKLDGPIMRVGSEDIPIPFNKNLEKGMMANSKLREKVEEILLY